MRIIEYHSVGKTGEPGTNEDAVVFGDRYVAVIDGATAKSLRTYDGLAPGRLIAGSIVRMLETETRELWGDALISQMTRHVGSEVIDRYGIRDRNEDTPSAAVAVFTRGANQITMLGDVRCLVNGNELTPPATRFDQFLSQLRALYIRMLLKDGASIDVLQRDDPGRRVIMPFLQKQHLLRNEREFGDWAYGAVDGISFDPKFVVTHGVSVGDEIVLCTDGYPELFPTLREAEAALKSALEADPLRIDRIPGTKGLAANAVSYDDRTYIRFVVTV